MSSPSRIAAAAVLCGVLASLPIACAAQAFKCRQPDGSTVFQQNPCPGSLQAPAAPPAQATRASSRDEPYYDPYSPENSRRRDAAIAALPRLPAPAPATVARQGRVSQENDRVRAENERTRAENAITRAENERTRAENDQNRAWVDKTVGCSRARNDLRAVTREPAANYEAGAKQAAAAQQRVSAECR